MKGFLNHFVRGLLFLFPIAATLLLIIAGVTWLDNLLAPILTRFLGFHIPGLGVLVMVFAIFIVGYIVNYIGKPLDYVVNNTISKMPIVKIIYNGLRDFSEALLGDKRKFNHPVMVKMSDSGIVKIGFVTQGELSQLGRSDLVAVYFPHSYNISGNLFLVPKDNVIKIEGNSTEIMKFVVSAGVTSADTLTDNKGIEEVEVIKNKPVKNK